MFRTAYICLLATSLVLTACGSTEPAGGDSSMAMTPRGPVSMDKNDYPVFPNADAGADPAISAEDGGAGFAGEGWTTNTDFDLIGDPRAVKGGSFTDYTPDFPATLRVHGPDAVLFDQWLDGIVYEGLLSLHPTTLEYMPNVATHWQISDDQMEFRFRINPNAQFSDGEPVMADDVVATWDFLMDPNIQAPSNRLSFGKFERPVAETPYIVSVKAKDLNWRNFLYFSASMTIYPEHVVSTLEDDDYLTEYNYKMFPGSGPYMVHADDIDRGNSITIRRREDYWAKDFRANVGLYNFDELTEVVARDQNLAFEMAKRGDIDIFTVNRAQWWVEELDFERIQRGLIQKRKIFNHKPNGIQATAFNMRRAPFNDIRVREALNLLFDRQKLISELMYNEYQPMNSHYAGTVYENPDNPKNEYDPERAMALLAEAGFSERDGQGRLTKDGQPFTIELLYPSQSSETYLTVVQEDLRKIGITLNLRLVTFATLIKLLDERNFDTIHVGYSGLTFPNPETTYHSTLADQPNSNNLTGFKNDRVDEITEIYDITFDIAERIALIQELDGIVMNTFPYMLEWYAGFQRYIYWNKFGHPEGYLTRTGDRFDPRMVWWVDPEKEAALNEARGDDSIQLEVGPTDIRYWLDFERRTDSAGS